MIKGPVPPGFTIAFRGRRKRWTWEQKVPRQDDDHVTERAGFTSWRHARADLDQELTRRREREAAAV